MTITTGSGTGITDLFNMFDQQTPMTMDETGTDVLMHTLTNLYGNPYKAVVREYLANAFDSHVEAGRQDVPVEVTLPTPLKPTLVIKDTGVGLSREQLDGIYSKYLTSTKRGVDSLIGKFGLGAKSAWAITEQFNVRAVKDGKVNEVILAKNGLRAGVMSFLPETDAAEGEHSGVTVSIPVHHVIRMAQVFQDVDFRRAWHTVPVKIDGVLVADTVNSDQFLHIPGLGWYSDHPIPTRYDQPNGLNILVGPVSYRVEGRFDSRVREHFVFDIDPATVSLIPSRESIIQEESDVYRFEALTNKADMWLLEHWQVEWLKAETGPKKAYAESRLEDFFGRDELKDFLTLHHSRGYRQRQKLLGEWVPYQFSVPGSEQVQEGVRFQSSVPVAVANWSIAQPVTVIPELIERTNGSFAQQNRFFSLHPRTTLIVVENARQSTAVGVDGEEKTTVEVPKVQLRRWLEVYENRQQVGAANGTAIVVVVPGTAEEALTDEGLSWVSGRVDDAVVREFAAAQNRRRRQARAEERQQQIDAGFVPAEPEPVVRTPLDITIVNEAEYPRLDHFSGQVTYSFTREATTLADLARRRVLLLSTSEIPAKRTEIPIRSPKRERLHRLTVAVLGDAVQVVVVPKNQHGRFEREAEDVVFLTLEEAFAETAGSFDTLTAGEERRMVHLEELARAEPGTVIQALAEEVAAGRVTDPVTAEALTVPASRLLALQEEFLARKMKADEEWRASRWRSDRPAKPAPVKPRYPLLRHLSTYELNVPAAVEYIELIDQKRAGENPPSN